MDIESMKAMDAALETLARQFYSEPDNQARAVELMQRELEPVIHLRLQALRQELAQCKQELIRVSGQLEATLRRHEAQVKGLLTFAQKVTHQHRDGEIGDVDGGFLQDTAVECGLLKKVLRDAPCGERCICAEVAGPPYECFETTSILDGVLPASEPAEAEYLLRQIFYARDVTGIKLCERLAEWRLEDLEPRIRKVLREPF